MSGYYINFYFRKLEYDDCFFAGEFETQELDVYCKFLYDRKSEEYYIWDNNRPVKDILPLPIGLLEYRLEKNGTLNTTESKICY